MKKVCLLLFVLILVLDVTACGKKGEEDIFAENNISIEEVAEIEEIPETEEAIVSEETHTESTEEELIEEYTYIPLDEGIYNLNKDFKDGLISEDEYVLYTLYDVYGDSRLDSKYESTLDMPVNINYLIEKYIDKLSEETLQYYWDMVCLKGIVSFGSEDDSLMEDSNGKGKFNNPFVLEVQANEFQIASQVLDNIVISENDNFVIWYSDDATHGINKGDAEFIAETLEKAVKEYEKLTGLTYKFESTTYKNGIHDVHEQQVNAITKNNYSADYLEKAMQVYVVDIPNGSCASYYSLPLSTRDEAIIALNGYDGRSPVMPYILINRSSVENLENCKQICNHEFFHHIQNVICGDNLKNYDVMMNEATANWFSAKISNTINGNYFLNEWSSNMITYASSLFTNLYISEGQLYVGYTIFPFLQFYEKHVNNGFNKIIDSIKQVDGLSYLESQATLNESVEIMKDMTLHNLVQDPNNGIILSAPSKNASLPITSEIRSENKNGRIRINNKSISKLHIDYYRIIFNKDWFTNKDFSLNFEYNEDNIQSSKVWMYIIGAKEVQGNTEYTLVSSLPLNINESSYQLSNEYCKNYDSLYIAVTNASMTTDYNYSLNVHMENVGTITTPEETLPEVNDNEEEVIVDSSEKIILTEEPIFELEDVPVEKMISLSDLPGLIRGIEDYEELDYCIRVIETKRITQSERNISSIQNGLEIIWHEPRLENVYSPINGTKYSYDVDELNRIFNAITTDRIFENNIPDAATLEGNVITFTPCTEEPEIRVAIRILRAYYDENNNICIDFNFKQLFNNEGISYNEGTTLACFELDDDTGKYKWGYLMNHNTRTVNVNE